MTEPSSISPSLARRLRAMHALAFGVARFGLIPGRLRIVRALARRVLPPLDSTTPVISSTVFGFSLSIAAGCGCSEYYRFGFYELGTLAVMRRFLRRGDVFVDAGASVGQMTMFASLAVGDEGRVLAFEPHSGRYQRLQETIALNRRANVSPFRVALSDRRGDVRLFVGRWSPSVVPRNAEENFEVIPAAPLADFMDGIASVRMLKIDVEGAEPLVLHGADRLLRSAAPPILVLEHGVYDEAGDVLQWLPERAGYRFFRLRDANSYRARLRPVDEPMRLRSGVNLVALPATVAADS